jgi:DNA-binding transcriptional LysR family regulator
MFVCSSCILRDGVRAAFWPSLAALLPAVRLAHAESIADLEGADWMLNTTPESIGQSIQNFFVRHGASAPRVVVECSSFSASFSLSVNSNLLSCCLKIFLETDWTRERIVAVPVREVSPHVSVGIISRRDALNTSACDYLIDCFVEAVAVAAAPLFQVRCRARARGVNGSRGRCAPRLDHSVQHDAPRLIR